jgi:chemotaxis protein MotB
MLSKLPRNTLVKAQSPSRRIDIAPQSSLSSSQWANDDANWMITLCDLTFLLLGFLVVWYVAANRQAITQSKAPVIGAERQKRPQMSKPMKSILDFNDWDVMREEMEGYVRKLGLKSEVRVESGQNEILISLKDTVPFASGRADLRQKAIPIIEKVAGIALSQGTLQLEIRGHTDDRPISTAEFPSNWELSGARASRVARYLVEKGVHPSRIAVQGYANQRPRLSNANAESRRANRRVEIRLYQNAELTTTRP